MAREAIGGEVLVRLGEGVPERIDLVAGKGGRSEFVRRAVLAALGDEGVVTSDGADDVDVVAPKPKVVVTKPAVVRVEPKPVVKAKPGSIPDAARPLVDVLQFRRLTAREASIELGWPIMRVEAAAKALGDRIVVRAGGVMELVDV